MDPNTETAETWNAVALRYQETFMNLDVYNGTYDHVCNAISKRHATLLEIGCGPGNITRYLLSRRPDFSIFGIDLAPNMVALARQNNPTAVFAVMDARHINRLETTYDGMIGGFCVPYLSQAETANLITHAHDLLNNNGLLYLSFVEGDPAQSGFKVGSDGRVYFFYHRLDDITQQLMRAHFVEIETFTVPYQVSATEVDIHTIVTAKKKAQ